MYIASIPIANPPQIKENSLKLAALPENDVIPRMMAHTTAVAIT